ncbi:hypothetical protein ACH5Y9_07115 [Methylomonas sp. BW4-1]
MTTRSPRKANKQKSSFKKFGRPRSFGGAQTNALDTPYARMQKTLIPKRNAVSTCIKTPKKLAKLAIASALSARMKTAKLMVWKRS